MNDLPIGWRELSTLGRWVMEGPRSLVTTPEPTGGDKGWLDRLVHWRRQLVYEGNHQSCTIFRRFEAEFEFEGAALPLFVVRFATWDATSDRAASRNDAARRLSVQVRHFELPATYVTELGGREAELQACITATLRDDFGSQVNSDEEVTKFYRWDYPGRFINQSLDWFSCPATTLLEQLWKATIPKQEGLRPVAGLIERFDLEVFGEYVDATTEQLPTIHLSL